jgi:hypothetical protein
MCIYFDRTAVKQCLEDDAEEVIDKTKVNFCEWFKPSGNAFDPAQANKEALARRELDSLFGADREENGAADATLKDAESLFK